MTGKGLPERHGTAMKNNKLYTPRSGIVWTFILVMGFSISGCTTMKLITREDMAGLEKDTPVWVKLREGERKKIEEPRVQEKALCGAVTDSGYQEIPWECIEGLYIKQAAPGRTKLLIGGAIAGVVVLGSGMIVKPIPAAGFDHCAGSGGHTYSI